MSVEQKPLPTEIEELFRAYGCIPNDDVESKKEFLDNVLNTLLCGCAEDTESWVYEFFIEWLDELVKDTKEGYDAAHKIYLANSDTWTADQKTIFYLVNGILENRGLMEHGISTRLPFVTDHYREAFRNRWQALPKNNPYENAYDESVLGFPKFN